LSLGIHCTLDEKYYLKYVPTARAATDPVDNVIDLMNQRRRWNNSSLYAFLWVHLNWRSFYKKSKHGDIAWIVLWFNMNMAYLSNANCYFIPYFINF
jgi:cellulose synthase/poly-beta-1,6-N-acetylglucosamine synthase-like glycosyltransferase